MMKNSTYIMMQAIFTLLQASVTLAQAPDLSNIKGELIPVAPTSADNLKLTMHRRCETYNLRGSSRDAGGNWYRVSMVQNKITVSLSINTGDLIDAPLCIPGPREEIDLGRLPAGNYTLDIVERAVGSFPQGTWVRNYPITVIDARATQAAPYVRLDYSGQWWDPNDPGWGIFIWHNANDQILAAWFTYSTDGRPVWLVYQPTIAGKPNPWETFSKTYTAPLFSMNRLPGTTVPPPTLTSAFPIGTAMFDFTNVGTADEGKFIYTLDYDGVTRTRTIKRFKP